jgi:hypothetical protein
MHEHVFVVNPSWTRGTRETVGSYTESMKVISTGRLNDVAAKVGEHAPMAATCCNACRTCVQTNLIALALGLGVGAVAWVSRLVRRSKPA